MRRSELSVQVLVRTKRPLLILLVILLLLPAVPAFRRVDLDFASS
jgi:hypothetical protein